MAALEEVARETLPPEMGYDWNAHVVPGEEGARARAARLRAVARAVVFLILAALYESWSLPFSVLLGTPIAVFGAFLGLLLRGLRQQRLSRRSASSC